MNRFSRLGIALIVLVSGCVSAAPGPVAALRYKLAVSSNGIYRVSAERMRNAGVDLTRVDATTLQLFQGDREIAIRVESPRDNLAFEFYGQATDSPYSPYNIYWFRWGIEKGKRMPEIDLAPPAATARATFQDTLYFSQPTLYVPLAGQPGSNWFWMSLSAPVTTTIPITLPTASLAPASLQLDLWGSTQDVASPNHHLRLSLNNVEIADESWAGQGPRTIQANIPAAAVQSGENILRLFAPGDARAPADVVLLRSIQATYARQFVAEKDALQFEGDQGVFRVNGFSGDAIDLFDITDPTAPGYVVNAAVGAHAINFAVDTPAPHRWLAIGPGGGSQVSTITPMAAPGLQATGLQADYVVITHPDFVDALQPLIQWRERSGLHVTVVTTDQIYDEFNYGAESPLAIRTFLDWTYHQWTPPAPRYVLLVGKASYDSKDYLDGPNQNLVPTFLVQTPHLGPAGSDNWFVEMGDPQGRPATAIERLSAKTPGEVSGVVKKIIAYESAQPADWQHRAIFVADDKEPQFAALADTLGQMLTGIAAQKTYLASKGGDLPSARTELLARWNAGALILTYIGHGSIDTWAAGPLFSSENLGDLANGGRLPILLTPTCLDGFFYHPQIDSLAEDLLFKEDGGIIAGLVPTGLSLPEPQAELMRAFFAELHTTPAPPLGEAIMRAKQKIASPSPDLREVVETFALLGDPALKIELDR